MSRNEHRDKMKARVTPTSHHGQVSSDHHLKHTKPVQTSCSPIHNYAPIVQQLKGLPIEVKTQNLSLVPTRANPTPKFSTK